MKAEDVKLGDFVRAKSDKVVEEVLKLEKNPNKINGCNSSYFEQAPRVSYIDVESYDWYRMHVQELN